MKKRLFGALLVPFLALGMLFTSCGGDDDVVNHDGTEAPSWFQDVFFSMRNVSNVSDTTWFVITGNQITMFDEANEARIAFRIDWAPRGGAYFNWHSGNVHTMNWSQEKAVHQMARGILAEFGCGTAGCGLLDDVANCANDDGVDGCLGHLARMDSTLGNLAFRNSVRWLARAENEPVSIREAADFVASPIGNAGSFWPTINMLADSGELGRILSHIFMDVMPVSFCEITFPRTLTAASVIGDFVARSENYFNESEYGVIPAHISNILGINMGVLAADRIVPFRITYFHFDSNEELGYNEGFWVSPNTGSPTQQFMVITQRNRRLGVMTEFLPEVGVWTTRQPTPEAPLPAATPQVLLNMANAFVAAGASDTAVESYRGFWIGPQVGAIGFLQTLHGMPVTGSAPVRPCGTGAAGPAVHPYRVAVTGTFTAAQIAAAGGGDDPNSGARVGIRIFLDGVPVGANQVMLVQNTAEGGGNVGIRLLGSYDMASSRFLPLPAAGGTIDMLADIWRVPGVPANGVVTVETVLFNWTGPDMSAAAVQAAIQAAFGN